MTDPVRHRQLEELNEVELCTRILYQSRNELYVQMHFLDAVLCSLGFQADWNRRGIATDGAVIFYSPDFLFKTYGNGRVRINRAYLHMLFHCLFCHLYTRKNRERRLWNLACDIAIESVIDGLLKSCVHVPQSSLRRETYLRLRKRLDPGGILGQDNRERQVSLTAERVYVLLEQENMNERRFSQLEAEFFVDEHDLWEENSSPQAKTQQKKWQDNREKMQTRIETMGEKEESQEEKDLLDSLQAENRERYDYREFLRKFSVLREEMQIDADSFDYAFYSYGMELYGNMPLIEPLETREVRRIEEFVIVIDTSMSCSGELISRFLEETCGILAQSESYFKKIHIHILQCDDKVQSDVRITNAEELKRYGEHLEIKGYGGTDFRPAFEYVEELRAKGELRGLKGLLYFTDGKGIYPVKAPTYDTAFIFIEKLFSEESVPPWAMKIILTEDEISEDSRKKEDRKQET